MYLKFIGEHGFMGLCNGQVYDVAIRADDAIIVTVYHNYKQIAAIPYSSPQILAANWEKP